MRPIFLALLAGAVLQVSAVAGDLRHFDDAALHAVQFVDRNEGWAVGDEGAIWHTIDGGESWERQPSGVRASLRSLHFLNPYTGWVVGREELPNGTGSSGVILVTRDGGLKWGRLGVNVMPGLNQVRFFNDQHGILIGDGSDAFPTGMYTTADGGRTWKPTPGPRCTSWLAAGFSDPKTGVLAGAWSRLATWRDGLLGAADVDTLGGRTLHGIHLDGQKAVAVGQGGLVLLSQSGGARWGYADLKLPTEVLACLDFHAVCGQGDRLWVAGRPGSVVLFSPDRGQTWQVQSTGQPLPLHALHFLDGQRGWAVGEMGAILSTSNGGKSWTVQRRGGQRAAALFLHARPETVPLDTLALLGNEDGYLTTALRVTASDSNSAAPRRAGEAATLGLAVRQVGGAAAETLWQFPLAEHLERMNKNELLEAWGRMHDGRADEQLLRQCVLALRIWQPEVIVTDSAKPQAMVDGLVADAVNEAFQRAADPKEFPEQIEQLGLEPCKAKKLYSLWHERTGAQVVIDLNELKPQLGGTARDLAAPAVRLLAETPVELSTQRFYHLIASRLEGAAQHRSLMDGTALAEGGTARRERKTFDQPTEELEKALRARRNLQTLAETPAGPLAGPDKLLAQIGPLLERLPDDQAAAAAHAIASQYVRRGQWPLAREAFLLMVDRYPSHPLSAEAYRWLIRHNSSSEARRRQELGQFLVVTHSQARIAREPNKDEKTPNHTEVVHHRKLTILGNMLEVRRWYEGCFAVENRLSAFGPLYSTDPAVQFCLQSAHRNLGQFDEAQQWYTQFKTDCVNGPWRDAAAAELWLANRAGPPPKPVLHCRQTALKPLLDGSFDDDCWQGLKPLVLRKAVLGRDRGDSAEARQAHEKDFLDQYPTEVMLAYDSNFLYLALKCGHPGEQPIEPVKSRQRDADLHAHDRVSLLLDLDRDYGTCFHFQVDCRGCVYDECWNDPKWDPRWFVAAQADAKTWRIEAAIPLIELTGDHVTVGKAWACNAVRIVPGQGVQAFSLPADVQPRPEGMGLLLFTPDPREQKRSPAPLAN